MKGKTTKRALVTSAVSLLLCVTMLIGTTFAWFTDTASTAVNKIQSGTLLVDIVDAADGETSLKNTELSFMQSNAEKNLTANENVLWEPGVTFKTQSFKIKNDGNLALKYKLTLNGVSGDSALLKVIEFSVVSVSNGVEKIEDLGTFEGYLITAGALSDELYIEGHMAESAGNEYQGKTLEGIGITVVATQYTYEYDSEGNQYDKLAEYPVKELLTVTPAVDNNNKTKDKTEIKSSTTAVADNTQPVVTAEVPAGVELAENATAVTLTVEEKNESAAQAAADAGLTIVNSNQTAKAFDITLEGVKKTNDTIESTDPVVVSIFIGKDLENIQLNHKQTPMTLGSSATELNDGEFYYNKTTGILAIASKSFSPFTIVYDTVKKVATADELISAINSAKDGAYIKLTADIEIPSSEYNVSNRLYVKADNVTLDLNENKLTAYNHTLTLSGENITVKNGSMQAMPTNSKQTYGSYCIAVTGKNATIDGVTMTGGVSVTGYNVDDSVVDGVCATIVNCNITDTNYYAVCAQGAATALVKNCTLTAENGIAFFWIEKGSTDELGTVADSSLTYETATVTMNGSKPLYNTGGLAPVAQ